MNVKLLILGLLLLVLFGCKSTPQQTIKPEELDRTVDETIVGLVKAHKKFGTNCSVVVEEVMKTQLKNEGASVKKNNDIYSYTLGVQTLLLVNYPIEYKLERIKKLQASFDGVTALCNKNPSMSYADALQKALNTTKVQ